MPRMTVTGEPITSPLSDPINRNVTPALPNPASLFWRSLGAVQYGQAFQAGYERSIIARRELAAKQQRAARVKVEWQEEEFV